MSHATPGLHHVTVISGEPRRNQRFYVDTLGLRQIKKTVNFDDPGTYHLYYGDRYGHPGTALTFFPFVNAAPGQAGRGEATRLVWRIPVGATAFWQERLAAAGIQTQIAHRFDEARLEAADPHGFCFALIEADDHVAVWSGSDVPLDAALAGFDGMDLMSSDPDATRAVLCDVLGFAAGPQAEGMARYVAGPATPEEATAGTGGRSVLDVLDARAQPRSGTGHGSVHHVAFRARDRAHQAALAAAAERAGLSPTPVIDRQYFESVYFREPGGVLFEIATDGPGFLVDEPEATLGQALMLPPRYEPRRAQIGAALPALDGPRSA